MSITLSLSAITIFLLYNIGIKGQLEALKKNVVSIAVTTSLIIDPEIHKKLNPDQLVVSEQLDDLNLVLHNIAESNPDITYIYTLVETKEPTKCKFVLASEDYGKKMIDPEDVVYDVSDKPELRSKAAFLEPVATKKFYRDKWGEFLTGYAPLKDSSGKTIAVVGVDMSAKKVEEFQRNVKYWSVMVFLANIIVSFILSLFISSFITTPLKTIARHTKLISEGDFNAKVVVETEDEIKVLADSFNTMSERLGTMFTDLNEAQNKLMKYMEDLKQSNNLLNRRVNELTILYNVSQAVNQTDDLDELMVMIMEYILKGVNSEIGRASCRERV